MMEYFGFFEEMDAYNGWEEVQEELAAEEDQD
jgi:hypothetical protein